LVIKRVNSSPKKGESVEAWAREQRYNIFSNLNQNFNQSGNILAHHQNDQAETFLLSALKGSGPLGLSAMPNKRRLNSIDIIRPLLKVSQKDIMEYAVKNKLDWIEDESNQNDKFDRNYLRKNVINIIQNRWPSSTVSLSRSAELCAENNTVLIDYIDNDIKKLYIDLNKPQVINYTYLVQFDFIKRKLIIKRWLEKTQSHIISFKILEQFCEQLVSAPSGWQYRINDQLTIRRYRDHLSIHNEKKEKQKSFCYPWRKNTKDIYIPEIDKIIIADDLINIGVKQEILNSDNLFLRSRQPKDVCKPIDRHKKNKLKIIFQEKGISSWKRKSAIILSLKENHQEKIIAVWPFFQCN